MAKKVTYTMSVIYDDEEVNAVHAVDHALFNIDGIYEWSYEINELVDVEYDED